MYFVFVVVYITCFCIYKYTRDYMTNNATNEGYRSPMMMAFKPIIERIT